jgi:NAD(P)-dependent dehydrogenase (short-subunit alcohol dehydrogenase family)
MGRELVVQLAAAGCSVATCDVSEVRLAETLAMAEAGAPAGTSVSTHLCDVSDEAQVLALRDAVHFELGDHLNLLFNNAGIGGAGSFIADSREEWERVFAVDWWGVYYCTRAFLPMLIAADQSTIVNTSSVNGFWAALAPGMPHTAYSTAKFAVKGFTESLIEDLRTNAPHVRVALVMPGYIATNIVGNSMRAFGLTDEAEIEKANAGWQENAPTSAAEAAAIILDGVRSGAWRILVGEDAQKLDEFVRANPQSTYDHEARTTFLGG